MMSVTSDFGSALSFLRERLTRAPRVVMILGSGLGHVADEISDALRIAYSEIPGFPRSTVAGHAGSLVAGVWRGVEIVALQGRFHVYEGWPTYSIVLPLRAVRALGADHLVVTNAAGGMNPTLVPGSLMLIADHINLMFRNPLIGRAVPREDPFPDLSNVYAFELRAAALRVADRIGVSLQQGVYAGVPGPSYETPAEIRMLARMGADAVGMSTIPEVLVARALNMKVVGFSCITNQAAGLSTSKLTHHEVLAAASAASGRLTHLLGELLSEVIPPNLPTEAAS